MHQDLLAAPLRRWRRRSRCPRPRRRKIIEIGALGTPATPSCPTSPCEVISRTTAFQSRVARQAQHVRRAGRRAHRRLVDHAGHARPKQRKFFEENLGGPAQAGITVLKPGDRHYGRVTAASPVSAAHAVLRPDRAVPAHHVAGDQPRATSSRSPCRPGRRRSASASARDSVWRASRDEDACDDTQTQSAQTDLRDLTQLQVRLPHGAADLQRDADHDAGRRRRSRAEAPTGRGPRAGRAAPRRPAGRTACPRGRAARPPRPPARARAGRAARAVIAT